jgi:ankyrin repeat protein
MRAMFQVRRCRAEILVVFCLLMFEGCVQPGSGKASPEAAKQVLRLRGYEFNEKSFFAATEARDVLAINAFLDAGINPNAQDLLKRQTALIAAASRGHREVVDALLKGGADVNVKDKGEYTALFRALENNHEEVGDVLLGQHSLDLNARGWHGVTALIAYVWRDRKDAVQKLLDRGADVNLQDADGDTAVHGAAQSGNVDILQMLLTKGANPNAKNKVGGTPLMWAAVFGHEETARALLDRGADASQKDKDGLTAAVWATRNKQDEIARLLHDAERPGTDIRSRSR